MELWVAATAVAAKSSCARGLPHWLRSQHAETVRCRPASPSGPDGRWLRGATANQIVGVLHATQDKYLRALRSTVAAARRINNAAKYINFWTSVVVRVVCRCPLKLIVPFEDL